MSFSRYNGLSQGDPHQSPGIASCGQLVRTDGLVHEASLSSGVRIFQAGGQPVPFDRQDFSKAIQVLVTEGGGQATIKANYALRSRTARGEGYRYDIIVPKGTPYPTQNGVTSIIANGFYSGQIEVELDIFRMDRPESSSDREIVVDDTGRMQLEENLGDEQQSFINEASPEIIPLDPPALDKERRLEITFDISLNRDLLITVKDLRRNQTIWKRKKSVRLE